MPVLTKPAEVPVFLCHDPHWEEQYDQLHSKLRAQWCAARREKDVERRGALVLAGMWAIILVVAVVANETVAIDPVTW